MTYREALTQLHALYAQLPALACQGHCTDCCGPIGLSALEYRVMQRTTPLTASYGLADSPAGLAAWIGEKFLLWADPASRIPTDTLLTNLSIYWFTNTIASSMRYYLESAETPLLLTERIAVPTHIARFPLEAPFPPRPYVERGYNVVRWTEMPRGGHFAALEAPDLLAEDIVACAPSPREAGRGSAKRG